MIRRMPRTACRRIRATLLLPALLCAACSLSELGGPVRADPEPAQDGVKTPLGDYDVWEARQQGYGYEQKIDLDGDREARNELEQTIRDLPPPNPKR